MIAYIGLHSTSAASNIFGIPFINLSDFLYRFVCFSNILFGPLCSFISQYSIVKYSERQISDNYIQAEGERWERDGFHHPTYTFYCHICIACTMIFPLCKLFIIFYWSHLYLVAHVDRMTHYQRNGELWWKSDK